MANKKQGAIILFEAVCLLKRKQVSGPPSNQPGLVDIDDLIQEDDWLQQLGEVYENLSVQHPIIILRRIQSLRLPQKEEDCLIQC